MNLFSLIRSSTAEIVLSKRVIAFLYAGIAAAIFLDMYVSSKQFINAYYDLREFDVSIGVFMWALLMFLLPLWLIGALIARAIVQRIRLAIWARRAFRIAEYEIGLSPAEAGLLVDSEFNYKEAAASLLHLHFKGAVFIEPENSGALVISRVKFDDRKLSYYEKYLIELLFAGSNQVSISSLRDPELADIFHKAHLAMIDQLTASGRLPKEVLSGAGMKKVIRVICGLGALPAIGHLVAYIEAPEQALNIVYPRYPVYPIQLWVLYTVILIIVATVLSGFWPRFSKFGGKGYKTAWMEAAGFMWYLQVVYRDRFSHRNLRSQDRSTIIKYAPYAVAFGFIHPTTKKLGEILYLSDSSEV